MMTPSMMRNPPVELTMSGMAPVMMLSTLNASTNSRHLRLETMLGDINCRERVRVVKAMSPDRDKPRMGNSLKYKERQNNELTNECCPLNPFCLIDSVRKNVRCSLC